MSTEHLYERYYYNRPGFENGTVTFHALCERHVSRGSAILEIGPGPSNATSDFLGTLGQLHGVDVSDEVRGNRAVRFAHVYDGTELPFADSTFDVCVSNYVLEHVADPGRHFKEVRRVLKPGGVYLFRTPNFWYYVSLISAVVPHRIHTAVANRLRSLGPESHEPWPTFYRANSTRALRREGADASLDLETCELIEREPSYGRASALLFFPMMVWERTLNATTFLAGLRANILGVMRRRG
jgi:Methylase involved in ubiquinone/menaquinone biosynthesis